MSKKYDMEVRLELEKYKNHDYEKLLITTANFIEGVDEAYGFYTDSMNGFNYVQKMMPESNKKAYFGNGDPSKGRIKSHHVATQSQVKQRNSLLGLNRKRAFQMLVIWIYMLWY